MTQFRLLGYIFGAVAIFLVVSSSANAQRCEQRKTIISITDVFESPPHYVTGVGWRGVISSRLFPGTEVYVCRELQVGFGFSTKTWVQIAYRSGAQWPKYGWVIKDAIHASRNWHLKEIFASIFIGSALAAPQNQSETAKVTNQLAELPTTPPELPTFLGDNNKIGSIAAMPANAADLVSLYFPLFVAMILGMVAKVAVDLLDEWGKGVIWAHLRSGMIAILVSPIVFLSMLSAGQFSGQVQTFFVLALLAFQSGFFWQTILKRESDRTASATVSRQN